MFTRLNRLSAVFIGFCAGIFITIVGIYVSRLPVKFSLAITLASVFMCIVAIFPSQAYTILTASIALFIPINVDINFFVRKHLGSASSLSLSAAWILILVLLFIISFKNLAKRKRFVFPPELILLMAYILWGTSGFIVARYPELLMLEIVRLTMLAIVVFTIAQIDQPEQLRIMVNFLLVALIMQSVIAIVQYFNIPGISFFTPPTKELSLLFPDQKINRAMGTLGHPNFLGYFVELLVPVAFALFMAHKSRLHSIFYMTCWLAGTLALILTKSRGAWAAYPIGIAVVWFAYAGSRILQRHILARAILSVCIGAIVVAFVLPLIKGRLFGEDYRAAAVRMPLNKAALSVFKQFPITGVGLNNFSEVFKIYDKTGFSRIFRGYKHVVHNMYLLVAVECGLPGLIILLAFLMSPFAYAWKMRNRQFETDTVLYATLVGICGGIGTHMVHCLVDPGFMLSRHVSFLIFLLIALSGSIYRNTLRTAFKAE